MKNKIILPILIFLLVISIANAQRIPYEYETQIQPLLTVSESFEVVNTILVYVILFILGPFAVYVVYNKKRYKELKRS